MHSVSASGRIRFLIHKAKEIGIVNVWFCSAFLWCGWIDGSVLPPSDLWMSICLSVSCHTNDSKCWNHWHLVLQSQAFFAVFSNSLCAKTRDACGSNTCLIIAYRTIDSKWTYLLHDLLSTCHLQRWQCWFHVHAGNFPCTLFHICIHDRMLCRKMRDVKQSLRSSLRYKLDKGHASFQQASKAKDEE